MNMGNKVDLLSKTLKNETKEFLTSMDPLNISTSSMPGPFPMSRRCTLTRSIQGM